MTTLISTFPDHLAYGSAVPETLRWENDAEVMDYYLHGERVLTVSIGADSATIQECWKGQALPGTSYPTLEQAALAHFHQLDQGSSPIHRFWMRQLCEIGNIYVDQLKHTQLSELSFPDVYQLTLHIPVLPENQDSIFRFTRHPLVSKYGYRYYSTTLFVNKLNGKQHQQQIYLLEVTVPLAIIHDLARAAVAAGTILKGKLYRAFVQPHHFSKAVSIKTWPAVAGDAWRAYGVVIRDRDNAQ